MLSNELIAKIRAIQFRAGHLVTNALSGEYISAFKGQGMEFDEVREYVPGDDVRSIDWNVTARMNQPFVKVFREEREMTMMLLVDVSASQGFGTTGRNKFEVAAELAAILAFLATKNNDKVGLIIFSDHVEHFIPAKKGRGHIWRIIREVLSHERRGTNTQIQKPLELLASVQKKRSSVFLISDFLTQDMSYLNTMRLVARRHDLVCVQMIDPSESQLPDAGLIEVMDAESGEYRTLYTGSKAFRDWFARFQDARFRELKSKWQSMKVGSFQVSTSGDTISPLENYMRHRDRLRSR